MQHVSVCERRMRTTSGWTALSGRVGENTRTEQAVAPFSACESRSRFSSAGSRCKVRAFLVGHAVTHGAASAVDRVAMHAGNRKISSRIGFQVTARRNAARVGLERQGRGGKRGGRLGDALHRGVGRAYDAQPGSGAAASCSQRQTVEMPIPAHHQLCTHVERCEAGHPPPV